MQQAMSLEQVVGAMAPAAAGGWAATIPSNWMQGRTGYGGLTAALALEAALRTVPDLPPLRSAQIGFVGPLAGDIRVEARVLRQGRNATFVQADILSHDGAVGLHALFVFMKTQPSSVDFSGPPLVPGLAPGVEPLVAPVEPPAFTGNFDYFLAQPGRPASREADLLFWIRLREQTAALDPYVVLLATGDALPPASLLLATRPGPASSINWTLNFAPEPPVTEDGWWLLRSTAHYARLGGSSQSMGIWNSKGVQVASAMQSVALFC